MVTLDLLVIIFSLIFGSFFNVVAIRLLKKESISYPPSHCTTCSHRLGALDLVPVFSYIFLRGRCRYCKDKISPSYPLGEGFTAVTIFIVYKEIGITPELIPALILSILLILAVLTDIREKLILDIITIPCLIILLIVRIFIGEEPFLTYLIGGLTGFVVLLLIAVISKGGMGGGDIKLYAVIGVALGPLLTIMSLVIASFFGAVVGIVLLTLKIVKRREPIAFGPFIFVGTLLAYLYGNHIWNWYSSLIF
ncbi:leader peptidase (prepilin peptidase)/N-methyltransferase [Bacillus mesophilus]|uniref:Prepilin peptidase n=1 Tax=Bacillus mesophilus TaxID=1808955 RepID=A0A6M0Q9J2_9BACI|nr:A24 family peptidase [Bacillus mesophilus]MBM7662314.1 leader peptidase (prepilin peptidase)/N-methyltransferase [Bacillus mesophilus]NEY73056.1 prepilin peptidase [Bacillus mesophilus]